MLPVAQVVSFCVTALLGWYFGGRSSWLRRASTALIETSAAVGYQLFRVLYAGSGRRRKGVTGVHSNRTTAERTNEVLTRLLQSLAQVSFEERNGGGSSNHNKKTAEAAAAERRAGGVRGAGGDGASPSTDLSTLLENALTTHEWKELLDFSTVTAADKQMLVLDLDETLIHSSVEKKLLCQPAFLLYDEDQRQHFYVYKRPFVDVFLKLLAPLYHIVVYTASFSSYSDPILDYIDPEAIIQRPYLSNNSLVETKLYGLQKDLNLVSREHMPGKLVMIDNSPIACMANQENLYVINSFRAHQPHDRELLSVFTLLLALHGIDDLRSVVHRRSVFSEK